LNRRANNKVANLQGEDLLSRGGVNVVRKIETGDGWDEGRGVVGGWMEMG